MACNVEEGVGEGPGRRAASGRHNPGVAAMGGRQWHVAVLRGDETGEGKDIDMWARGYSARRRGWLTHGAWPLCWQFNLFKPI
jgi:hypothetical protein